MVRAIAPSRERFVTQLRPRCRSRRCPFPTSIPVLVQIGPLAIHWYGVAYIVGILFGWWYAKRLVTDERLWARRRQRR